MTRIRILIMAFVGFFLLTAMPANLPGQGNRTSLTGSVTDPTGAVVPGAQVTLVEVSTQARHETTSDRGGGYGFPSVSLGSYTLTVSVSGFKTLVRRGIRLYAGDDERLDVSLDLGAVTEEITVTGTLTLLEPSEPVYTTSIAVETLARLPIALDRGRRTPVQFFTGVPGFQSAAGFDSRVNGSIGTYSELLIDGVPYSANPVAGTLFNNGFSIEVVEEFTMAEAPSADQGPTGGVIFSFVSKGGSNTLHGSLYEYHKNDSLDARSFFASNQTKGIHNEYGFTVGGPVYLGDAYDGRNKTFFFFQWSATKFRTGAGARVDSMAPTAFRRGDFSSELALGAGVIGTDALGRPVQQNTIYDPLTTRTVAAGAMDGPTGLVNNTAKDAIMRDPFNFGGNINTIDPLRFSTLSRSYQSFFPTPQTSARVDNFISGGGAGVRDEPVWSLKVDQIIGNNRFSVLYWRGRRIISKPFGLPEFFRNRDSNVAAGSNHRLSWTRTVSPTVVNDFIFGVDRNLEAIDTTGVAGSGASLVGQPNALGGCGPGVSIAGFFAHINGGTLCKQGQFNTNFGLSNNVSWARGKHFVKIGGNYNSWAANFPRVNNAAFRFLPAQTSLPGAFTDLDGNPATGRTGISYASFLLGGVDNATALGPQEARPRMHILGLYVQDNWRVSSKLTLELGLRWDLQPLPFYENDALSQFDPTVPNPGAGGLLGALTFAGSGPGRIGRRSFADSRFTDFGPRLGFAYRAQDKTVIRGNWGLYYGPVRETSQGYGNSFQQGIFPVFDRESLDGISAAFNWDTGFPLPPNPTVPDLSPEAVNGSSTAFYGPDAAHAPRIHQVHFSIQREIAQKTLLEASFIGKYAHGIHSAGLEQLNQLDYAQFGSLGGLLSADIYSPEAVAAGISIPFSGFKGSVAQALRPFPQYLNIKNQASPTGFDTYNSFQLKLQKQYANGLTFLVGYTIAKAMTNSSVAGISAPAPQDANNRRAEKTIKSFDVPQQLLLHYLYELPFGPGKRFGSGNNMFLRHVIGGWAISGIHTYNAGKPIAITTQRRLPTMVPRLRPDRVPGVPARTGVSCADYVPGQRLLNIAAFADPAPFTFGNSSRRLPVARGCASSIENVSLVKTFTISEGVKAVLGGHFFNMPNRHNWDLPRADFDNKETFGKINRVGDGSSASRRFSGRQIQVFVRLEW
jgi:hypothetical protein